MRRRFWTKKLKIVVAIAAVLAVLITLGAAMGQGMGVGIGKNLISSLITPIRSGVRAIDSEFVKIYDYVYRYETLEAENEALKQRLAQLESDRDASEQYRRENQRLRELLGLEQENRDFSYAAANIVSWSSSMWESRLTLDKGTSSGLKEGMCAVTGTGQVVGVLVECGTNWSTVATMYDVSVRVNAKVGPYVGVLQPIRQESGEVTLQLRYLSSSAELEKGARIVTSGSGKYPDGLLLGTVDYTGMDETGISKYAVVTCPLDLNGLEQVFLITEYEN